MGLFNSDASKLRNNLQDEKYYEVTATEIASGNVRPGLWAKALSESSGNEAKTQARYIQLRVGQLKTEHGAINEFVRDIAAIEASAEGSKSDSNTPPQPAYSPPQRPAPQGKIKNVIYTYLLFLFSSIISIKATYSVLGYIGAALAIFGLYRFFVNSFGRSWSEGLAVTWGILIFPVLFVGTLLFLTATGG